MYITKVSD